MMMMFRILLCLLASPVWASSEMPLNYLNESFEVERTPHVKKLQVSGNLDETRFLWPNMPAKKRFFSKIRITNEGDRNIINPRLRINGFRIPLSSDELKRNISHESRDPLDRVLRAFYAMCNYSAHAAPVIEARNPVSYFLHHSYGICDDMKAVQAELWQLFGYKWRTSGPYNHDSAEVEVDGKRVHLDSNLKTFYLMYDNKTIASAQDIHDDPMLVMRASHERVYDRFPRMPGDPEVDMYFSSEKYAALYGQGPLIEPLVFNKPEKKAVRIVLRPGESYGWQTGERRMAHAFNDDPGVSDVSRDVLWETHLNMSNKAHLWFLSDTAEKVKVQNLGRVDLKKTLVTLPYHLPFPLLGMAIRLMSHATRVPDGSDLNEKICVRLITPKKTMEDFVTLKEIFKGEYSLDHLVRGLPYPLTKFRIEIDGRKLLLTNYEDFSMSDILVKLNCLSTIFAMRALQAGENTLVYSDDSSLRSVKITAEARGEHMTLPRFPNDDVYPSANAKIPDATLEYVWPAAVDDSVAGYHFQISAFSDMRYPLSPTFDRLVKEAQIKVIGGKVQFRLPWHGMLPVQKKLHWRVRPYNNDLLAGDWSKTASFEVWGPGAPEQIKLTEQEGKFVLSWKAASYGTKPVFYEIHSSNLDGFFPVDRPHRLLGLSDRNTDKRCWHDTCATAWPIVPSTFFSSTRETSLVLIPSDVKNLKKKLGAHWRVIAVDARGSRSCPSPQGFLRTPLLIPPEIIVFPPGKVTYRVPVISTLGRIYTKGIYDMGLWSKPQITFSLKKSLGLAKNERVTLDMLPADFTVRGYSEANPDLSAFYNASKKVQIHYGTYDNFLIDHYGHHGIAEGRIYNVTKVPSVEEHLGWKIDKKTGLITGALKSNEEASVHVSVQDQFGRKDKRVIKIRTEGK